MKCNQWMLYEQGQLSAADFQKHAASCPICRQEAHWAQALQAALIPPAAPAALVEAVFAKTTRKPGWFTRWRTVLAGSMAAVLLAAGVYVTAFHTGPFNNAELVAYMSETGQDGYSSFLQDLNLFEQEF